MKYKEWLAQIARDELSPVYLFVGEEDFLKEEAIEKIKSILLDQATSDFNLDVFYGGQEGLTRAIGVAHTPPLLAQRRLVILKEVDRITPSDQRVLLSYVRNPSPTTCLILVGPRVDLDKGFFGQLSQMASTVVCWPLFENQLPGWIEERLRQRDKSVSPQAVALLQERVGNDLLALDNEVEKLVLYLGPRERVEVEDVAAVAGGSRRYTVFDLNAAVGNRDLILALQILDHLLEVGESPPALVNMLTGYFTALLRVKRVNTPSRSSQEVARLAQVKPFLIKDYIRQAGNFSIAELKQAFGLLLEADTRLKSGYQKPRMVMELLVYGLCHACELPVFLRPF